jgi:hypothetical protein
MAYAVNMVVGYEVLAWWFTEEEESPAKRSMRWLDMMAKLRCSGARLEHRTRWWCLAEKTKSM